MVSGPLDQLGRPLRDLRISVIDRCNFRCPYCMPADLFTEDYAFVDRTEWLTFDEIERLARIFVEAGVRKLRITGGEPLLRPGIEELVERLARFPEVDDLALTTNGLLLGRLATRLADAGLGRITVSMDSLDPETFERMSGRRGSIDQVLAGIDAAEAAGFTALKINCVVQRGVNDRQVMDLVAHFRETPHILRLIEFMDVGNRNGWNLEQVVPSRELRERIHARWPLKALPPEYAGEVARRYAFADGAGEIGFISSVSQPFCGDCSRARLSCDGKLFTCLFAGAGHDVMGMLRGGASDTELSGFVAALWGARRDRYSELRGEETRKGKKIEMYRMGG
ncbi:MAG: GTP 3',8-cyclase MoaA [Xanthomonadales bacterium]|nr:GTP 3',8-cyclase MoaA [Xanthomonadales bacterium]